MDLLQDLRRSLETTWNSLSQSIFSSKRYLNIRYNSPFWRFLLYQTIPFYVYQKAPSNPPKLNSLGRGRHRNMSPHPSKHNKYLSPLALQKQRLWYKLIPTYKSIHTNYYLCILELCCAIWIVNLFWNFNFENKLANQRIKIFKPEASYKGFKFTARREANNYFVLPFVRSAICTFFTSDSSMSDNPTCKQFFYCV